MSMRDHSTSVHEYRGAGDQSPGHADDWWRNVSHTLRRWRRAAKSHLPYVRRREYAKLTRKYNALANGVGLLTRRACDARIEAIKPVTAPLVGDVCLFLCHHEGPSLKPHVLVHLQHLLASGVRVVLILNSDEFHPWVDMEPALSRRLSGIYLRDNEGFDFAGWAHVHSLIRPMLNAARLMLVNDSVAGPLAPQQFKDMIGRIRASRADMVGLTEALKPIPHLQSYFLVFQRRLLHGDELVRFFDSVLSFDDKATVIDVYEIRLTQRMRDAGYGCEALFPAMSDDPYASNDTYFRWVELLDCGFPYVKMSVLREFGQHPRLRELDIG